MNTKMRLKFSLRQRHKKISMDGT